uniref:RING-type domain-containing protein n=1 Tax=Panagrolaimus sp. PS1159 TaxID=55785 RepID=A0AC35FIA8_9BILA
MNSLVNAPIAAIQCGHVFHFRCIHSWLLNSGVENEKNCPSCRTRAKLYDVIRLFGIFEKEEENNEEKEETNDGDTNIEIQQYDAKKFEELAILRTENSALKRDIRILQVSDFM